MANNFKGCKALKIISALVYFLMTAFLAIVLVDIILNPGDLPGLGFALFLIIFVLIIGSIGYAITLILSVIGSVLAAKSLPLGGKKSTLVFFIVFSILPVVTEGLFVLISIILPKVIVY